MRIITDRFTNNGNATLSLISINGVWECFGLEDEPRDVKVYGETRIPAGIYKIGLRTEGSMHPRYAQRFPSLHQGMLHILDVPNFEYVYIHIGNREDQTDACLLPGQVASSGPELTVGRSALAYEALYRKVLPAVLADDLVIEFQDNDR